MSALQKLIALSLLAIFSVPVFAITDGEVFAYAAANYPGLFKGTATAGQYQQYNYRYYPASGNYLAVDTSGVVSMVGIYTGGRIIPVAPVSTLTDAITHWRASLSGTIAHGTVMGGSIQGVALGLAGVVSTFSGSVSAGAADGIGTMASFNNPDGITTDGTNLYVADTSNNKIRKIAIATGAVSTLAGSGAKSSVDGFGAAATFSSPFAITTDGANLYVTDLGDNKIRKVVIATGEVTTLAGSGVLTAPISNFGGLIGPSGSCVNGIGAAASFNNPVGITTDGTNLYVTELNCNMIRKIVIATGEVTSLVDAPAGPWTVEALHGPYGITTDGTNLYVTEFSGQRIRKIVIATGAMTTLAGTGTTGRAVDGIGLAASFSYPQGITTDGSNLYVADWANGMIRKVVIATGDVTTLAGAVTGASAVDGTGAAASFNGLAGITTDGVSLYVADRVSGNGINNSIRKIR